MTVKLGPKWQANCNHWPSHHLGASRLRRMVSQLSPAWAPSRLNISKSLLSPWCPKCDSGCPTDVPLSQPPNSAHGRNSGHLVVICCHMSYIYIYLYTIKKYYIYIYTRTLLILWDFWIHIMWCKSKLYCKFENVPVQKAQLPSLSQLLRWKASSSLVHDAGLKRGYMAILSALMGLQ